MVQKRDHAIFEILLTTNFDTNYKLIDVLHSFCINFILDLEKKLWEVHNYLRDQREKINKEEAVIDNLLSHYEAEPHFKGLFPDWLVEKRKNNHFNSTQIFLKMDFIHKLIAIAHVT
ncbi:hypothetical protein RCL_jg26514.t1 [Rhizophagus clarus]|uniref:Uncharacterized protein n=1 Tax=Rhizophagus clarus TaxID=94130 RepID=A0A8H3LK26_9GLOM|nr:hypothetical protein RCL_jg26514.t1 [Rhizophagus clarus]